MAGELLRAIGLTTLVLVAVIAFGATIKPLASDNLLSVGQTAKYLLLVTVPMLQFALPFAGGFAVTLVVHRFASDNEIAAMSAGGFSHRRVLMPVAALGMIALLLMLILTQSVIPRFWGLMQKTIAADVVQLFQASIDRDAPFTMGNIQIYADDMRTVQSPEGSDADAQIQLWHIAAAELDEEGRIATDLTAESAVIDVYREEGAILLNLIMVDPVASERETGRFVRSSSVASSTIYLPNQLRDDPVTMTRGEMLRHHADPDSFRPIRQRYRDLADLLHRVTTRETIEAALRDSGSVELIDPGMAGARYRLQRQNGMARAISLTRFDGSVALWRAHGSSFALHWPEQSAMSAGGFELAVDDVLIEDLLAGGPATPREQLSVPNLRTGGSDAAWWREQPISTLVEEANARSGDSYELHTAVKRITFDRMALRREIRSRLMERYALSLTAPLLLLLGAVLALAYRSALPLNIYLWAFLPSVIDLVLISGGQDMVEEDHPLGEVVLWMGNVALLGLIIILYRRVRRN